MKYSRHAGAAALFLVTALSLTSYSGATNRLPLAAAVQEAVASEVDAIAPAAEIAETAPPDETAASAPQETLFLTVCDEDGDAGQEYVLCDAEGNTLSTYTSSERRDILLSLVPGGIYTLTTQDGAQQITFQFGENASVRNVTGDGWTDGELLHFSSQPRCTLRILRTLPEETTIYTLTGDDVNESRTLYAVDKDAPGSAVFSGLLPGAYILSCSDGTQRSVTLTAEMPDLTLGMD